jgi:nucleoside diphosphate kinase
MKSRNLKTNAHDVPTGILRSDFAEEGGKNGPTPAEIRQRAFEIHIERGGIHGCDLDDWMQAERELRTRYRRDTDANKT